jgi:hypothetical protein
MQLFLWGYFKSCVFLSPLPQNLPELQIHIIAAVSATDCDVLQQVWAKWIISLRSAMWQKVDTHMTFEVWKKTWWISLPSVGHMLQSFLAFKRTDFMECCGIMNNSVHMTCIAN